VHANFRLRPAAWLAAVLAAGAVLAPGAGAVPAPAYYDPTMAAFVVPYEARLPAVETHVLAAPPRVTLDFAPGLGLKRPIGGAITGDPLLAAWAMAPAAGGRVRLTLTFRRPAAVELHDDGLHHRLVLAPIAASPPSPTPSPAPTATPTPGRTEPLPLVSFLPIVPTASPSPTPSAALLPSPLPTPAGAPSSAATPGPVAPSPAAPSPAPTVAPPAPGAATELARLRPDVFLTSYAEHYPAGQVDTAIAGVRVQGIELEGHWPSPWVELARLDAASYAFQDLNLPGSTHVRDAWRGELAAMYELAWGPLALDLGPGYMLRVEPASHTGVPPTPTYAFSSVRLLHAPEVTARLRWQVGWGLGLYADAAVMPYVFSAIDGDLPALPSLFGYRAEAGVEQALGPVILGLAYRQRALTGSGYDEAFGGPGLWLGVRAGLP